MALGSLIVRIVGDASQFNKTIAQTQRQLNAQTKGMMTLGKTFTQVGTGMTKAITLPLLAVGAASIKVGADFHDGMAKSLAIMNDVSPEIRKQMEETAKAVVDYTTFSATEASEAYFYLASAGLDAAQSMEALPRVAKFAQAGNFDLALATDLLTDAQSALGMTIRDDVIKNMENMTRVSDVLVKANTIANATVEQFSESLTTRAGAALRLVNKDIEEGVAVLAAWADQGTKGAEAGTRLDIVLRDLQRASIKNREIFDEYNISIYDTDGNMRNLADIIGDMEIAFDGMSDEQLRSTLMLLGFQDRSIAATASLLGMSDAIRGYEDKLRDATGYTEEVAAKQMESFTAQVTQLKNQAIVAGIAIFEILLPYLVKLIEKVESGVEWFRNLSDENKKLVVNIALVTGALPLAILLIGKTITGVIQLRNAILLLNAATKGTLATIAPLVAGYGAVGAAALGVSNRLNAITFGFSDNLAAVEGWNRRILEIINILLLGIPEILTALTNLFLPENWKLGEFEIGYGKMIETLFGGGTQNKIGGMAEATATLSKETEDYVNKSTEEKIALKDKQGVIDNLISLYGLSREEAEEYYEATEEGTDIIEDQAGAIDNLRSSFNKLIDDLFGHITTYNDFEEAQWAVEDAQKALTEAINEYGEGSREAKQAQNILDDAMIANIKTAFELSTEINATTEEQEEARKKAVELGLEYVNAGELGVDAFMKMASDFGLSSADIIKLADEMDIEIDDAVRARLIDVDADITKAQGGISTVDSEGTTLEEKTFTPKTDVGTSKALWKLSKLDKKLSAFAGRKVTATVGASWSGGGIAGFAGGGIADRVISQNMIIPKFDSGGILAMLHPPELVLNEKNALKILWNMANRDISSGSTPKVTQQNEINIYGEVSPAKLLREEELLLKKLEMELGV